MKNNKDNKKRNYTRKIKGWLGDAFIDMPHSENTYARTNTAYWGENQHYYICNRRVKIITVPPKK